jgi:hypothetical protein
LPIAFLDLMKQRQARRRDRRGRKHGRVIKSLINFEQEKVIHRGGTQSLQPIAPGADIPGGHVIRREPEFLQIANFETMPVGFF